MLHMFVGTVTKQVSGRRKATFNITSAVKKPHLDSAKVLCVFSFHLYVHNRQDFCSFCMRAQSV